MNTNSVPSVHQVADLFLSNVDVSAGDSITSLKLQKLCYFAQAISLAENQCPIFAEPIEAWAHGPVVPILYRRFKQYGWQSIDPTDTKNKPRLNGNHAPLVKKIWDVLSPFSAKALEKITHNHAPWLNAYGDTPSGGRCDVVIEQNDIETFYRKEKQKEWWQGLVGKFDSSVSAS